MCGHRRCIGRTVQQRRPVVVVVGLRAAVSEFGALSAAVRRADAAYSAQLSASAALHFVGALVGAYLFCYGALLAAAETTSLADAVGGGARALNDLWRLSAVSGAAHCAHKQVRRV